MAKSTKIDVKEFTRLGKEINKHAGLTAHHVEKAVHKFAILIDRKAKEKIQSGGGGGRTYRRGSVTHRASAPGESPKSDTGRLVSSIRPTFGKMSAEVGSLENIAKYGEFLEKGTSTMKKRPWLKPTLEENAHMLKAGITAAIKSGGLAR
jgi:HK97 gp10 family phage protein